MQRGLFWLRNYFKLNFESLYRVRMTHDVNKRDFVASRNSNSEHLLRLDTSWSSGEESNQKLGKTLLKKKTCCQTKDNMVDRNSRRYQQSQWSQASSYTSWKTTNQKTAKEHDTDKLWKLCSERKASRPKRLSTIVYQADECALHIYYLC